MIYRLYDLDDGHETTLGYIELPPGRDGKDQDERLEEVLQGYEVEFERVLTRTFTTADEVAFWFEARDLEKPEIPPATSNLLSVKVNGIEVGRITKFEISTIEAPQLCSICREPQYHTPSGWTCKNGHGGVDPL